MPNNLLQIQSKQLQRAIQEVAEATGDLIGNKIDDKLQELQKIINNNSETNTEEIPMERYISPGQRKNYWWSTINIKITYNNNISKIINLLDSTQKEPSKLKTKN